LDWTLIGTKSGRVYPKDKDDWCILMPEIPGKLKKLHAEGFKLVIFSNQAGIGSRRVVKSDFQQKVFLF
jgi:bifunctional polynucleotide phosphatase/kinase